MTAALHGLGWFFGRDGRLRDTTKGQLYSRDAFDGDYEELAAGITAHVLEALTQAPCSLERLELRDGHKISCHVFASAGAAEHRGHLLVLIPGIGCRAGIWSRSLCATHSLGYGAMFDFLRIAREAGMAQVVFDPNDNDDPHDGELHAGHCVHAWQQVVERSAASEVFVVAHSFGGASLIDVLAMASQESLERITGIAFTDSVHGISGECLQLREGGLPPEALSILSAHAVHWQADEAPLDTEIYAFNEDRGCRCVSAGVNEHASTNAFACRSIFAFFAAQSKSALRCSVNDTADAARHLETLAESDNEEQMRCIFREWDTNGDGWISLEDLVNVTHVLCPSIPRECLREVFAAKDLNKDGVIDYGELSAWVYSGAAGSGKQKAAPARTPARVAKHRRLGVTVEHSYAITDDTSLFLASGNICKFEGCAIVNPADPGCLGGRGGVDKAISAAGGQKLREARKALKVVSSGGAKAVRCPPGEARVTVGGALKARFCIHAVGPHYNRTTPFAESDALLVRAYQAALQCAEEKKLRAVAFAPISAGHFRGPQSLQRVFECAIEGIRAGAYEGLREVYLLLDMTRERSSAEDPMTLVKDICDSTM